MTNHAFVFHLTDKMLTTKNNQSWVGGRPQYPRNGCGESNKTSGDQYEQVMR